MEELPPDTIEVQKIWKKFLNENCNDNLEITETPIYTLLKQSFTVLLLRKLLSIAIDSTSTYPVMSRNRAAKLIQDIALSDRLDAAYATINKGTTLLSLRKGAINLLHSNLARGSARYAAGKELTKKLVRLTLQHNDDWVRLRCFLYMGLDTVEEGHILQSLVDVFCELDDDRFGIDVDNEDDLRRKFAAFLEPTARENFDDFHKMLIYLLNEDEKNDNRPFLMLRFFHHIFTDEDRRAALMKAAIMSPFFTHSFSKKWLASAIYLRVCIEEGEEFGFSLRMIERLQVIIRYLRQAWLPRAEMEATKLKSAIVRRPEYSSSEDRSYRVL